MYGQTPFDPATYEVETKAKLATIATLCDIANEKKCSISFEGMSASPAIDRPAFPEANPGKELLGTLRFLAKLRKAAGAFLDNLPED